MPDMHTPCTTCAKTIVRQGPQARVSLSCVHVRSELWSIAEASLLEQRERHVFERTGRAFIMTLKGLVITLLMTA